jgi:hypothetical protein
VGTPPLRKALAVAALWACILVPGAEAHFGTGKLGYRSTIESVKPRVQGIQTNVLYGDDQVWMDNRSGKTVVIEGYGGEPYLRFAPAGIFVNVNSPAGYLNQDRYGKTVPPKSATVNARPEWQQLTGGKTWAWHDHRIHYMSPEFPPKIKAEPDKPHHVFDWRVPATADGKRFFISGSLDYGPPPEESQSFPVTLVIALAVLIGAGMVGLFFLRRVILRSLE